MIKNYKNTWSHNTGVLEILDMFLIITQYMKPYYLKYWKCF